MARLHHSEGGEQGSPARTNLGTISLHKLTQAVDNLILHIGITQFKTNQILKRFEQSLVHVEIWQLCVLVEKTRDRVMNGAHRHLGNDVILVTNCLHQMW
uniref:Uncharacterized protein n=1 Tax=Cacopsylla melanoneura TaxID=428564 RepID=A0A8D8U5R5_9HEMI